MPGWLSDHFYRATLC